MRYQNGDLFVAAKVTIIECPDFLNIVPQHSGHLTTIVQFAGERFMVVASFPRIITGMGFGSKAELLIDFNPLETPSLHSRNPWRQLNPL